MAEKRKTLTGRKDTSTASLGFERKLWLAADKLRNNIDAAEYKHGVLGLKFGVPPKGNANFAWVQHFIHHLAPHGMAGFVHANGSMSSNQSGEGDIRRALIEADLVDCMVAPSPASSSTARRYPSASGSSRKTKTPTPNAASATGAKRCCSFFHTSAPILDQQPSIIDLWHN
jgi:hypothetical protein